MDRPNDLLLDQQLHTTPCGGESSNCCPSCGSCSGQCSAKYPQTSDRSLCGVRKTNWLRTSLCMRTELRAGFTTSRRCAADTLRPAASTVLDGHPARHRTLSLQCLRLFAPLGPVLKPAQTIENVQVDGSIFARMKSVSVARLTCRSKLALVLESRRRHPRTFHWSTALPSISNVVSTTRRTAMTRRALCDATSSPRSTRSATNASACQRASLAVCWIVVADRAANSNGSASSLSAAPTRLLPERDPHRRCADGWGHLNSMKLQPRREVNDER